MACPFAPRHRVDSLHRQQSTVEDLELQEVSDDSLTLTHLNAAIQLLTGPSVNIINEYVHNDLINIILIIEC